MGNLEKSTDMEVAFFLAGHIINPCTVKVKGEVHSMRESYLKEAKRVLSGLTDPNAIQSLESVIEVYS
jgi:hypothetical protein